MTHQVVGCCGSLPSDFCYCCCCSDDGVSAHNDDRPFLAQTRTWLPPSRVLKAMLLKIDPMMTPPPPSRIVDVEYSLIEEGRGLKLRQFLVLFVLMKLSAVTFGIAGVDTAQEELE